MAVNPRRIVLTCGVFDLLHAGHVAYLKRCASLGDELVVAVMTDRWTAGFKGQAPVYNQEERRRIVGALRFVDRTLLMDEIDPTEAMKASGCRVFVHGNDWLRPGEDLGQRLPPRAREWILSCRVDLVLVPYTDGVSTSAVRDRLRNQRPDGA